MDRIVYNTKKYKVVQNSDKPTSVYNVYSKETEELVKAAKTQVEATMWIEKKDKTERLGGIRVKGRKI